MDNEKVQHDFHQTYATIKNCDVIGLVGQKTWDHESLVCLADRFISHEHMFMLESASAGAGSVARYSFIGFDILCSWEMRKEGTIYHQRGNRPGKLTYSVQENPVSKLYHEILKLKVDHILPSLYRGQEMSSLSGAVGFFSYDFGSYLEPCVGKSPQKSLDLPDMFFMIPQNLLVFDQLSRTLTFISYSFIDDTDTRDPRMAFEKYRQRFSGLSKMLEKSHKVAPLLTASKPLNYRIFSSSIEKSKFIVLTNRCLEEIKRGEIYQIQIGNRMSSNCHGRPFDLFRHLRILNPSPYMFFYKFGKDHILGSSPEMMVNVKDDLVTHRPIAGTRRRTWNPEQDLKMVEELKSSQKERAEHVMLVDLSRNDISRVAIPGSLHVKELMVVEKFSHVFHLVSEISGRLRPGMTAADAMTAAFPNGTVCGAPKIRAMQLINELESCAREFYAGSLGMFMLNGDLKSTLLIRTMHVRDSVASTQASAGIVYDSVAEHEWKETLHKMAACLLTIQNTL